MKCKILVFEQKQLKYLTLNMFHLNNIRMKFCLQMNLMLQTNLLRIDNVRLFLLELDSYAK